MSTVQIDNLDIPIINANSDIADYRVNKDWIKGQWKISSKVEFDEIIIPCFNDNQEFEFKTDLASIIFDIKAREKKKFFVQLKDKSLALTIVKGVKLDFTPLTFSNSKSNNVFQFWHTNINDKYSSVLRVKYKLESIVSYAKDDTEKVLKMLHWVHNRWSHNGINTPPKNDALTILDLAEKGSNFRCVEYGIVLKECLNAIGLKSRTIALKQKNVETIKYGAGHVATEVFLNDLQKWIFVDPQWNAMPMINNIPLNAVEFQKAISKNYSDLLIKPLSEVPKSFFCYWIFPYLYYFDINFDNTNMNRQINEKSSLMLLPKGAKEPKVFQIDLELDYLLFTNSLEVFYRKPNY